MKTIHKFPLVVTEEQTISLPKGAVLLSSQIQNGVPILWAEVDTNAEKHAVTVKMFGTGCEIPEDEWLLFCGSFQINGYVWHAYLLNEPSGDIYIS
ncbi:MAG: hypothetical protein LUE98_11935 [Tannerellaceae bacterium]|nr:hypothetical protein [Tannerellaceae bacterium]